jgi:hypothetical protein
VAGFLIPFVASVGSLYVGIRVGPVLRLAPRPRRGGTYLVETLIILDRRGSSTPSQRGRAVLRPDLTSPPTQHALAARTAAAMDIGGAKDEWVRFGRDRLVPDIRRFAGRVALGALIDHVGWGSYFYFMAPFGLLGGTADDLRQRLS